MAPRFDFVRCRAPIEAEVDGEPYHAGQDDDSEYGYLQIDDYRSYKRGSNEAKLTRWVSLPRGTPVHTYDNSNDNFACAGFVSEASPTSPRSCTSRFDREGTASTVASSSDDRNVRFGDGLLPGSLNAPARHGSVHELKTTLAEWVFIDRDICGFSLQEYDPGSAIKDFVSSPYGLMSLMEQQHVASLNEIKQQKAALCKESVQKARSEERQLDKALLMAGVHVNLIHETSDASAPNVTVVSL